MPLSFISFTMTPKGGLLRQNSKNLKARNSIIIQQLFMAYDERLAERMREALGSYSGVKEKKMFGGLAFMMKDKMFVGIVKNDLVVRVGKERNEDALKKPHSRQMDFTGNL